MTVKLLTGHHLKFLSLKGRRQTPLSLHLSKRHIVGNHMPWLFFCFYYVSAHMYFVIKTSICIKDQFNLRGWRKNSYSFLEEHKEWPTCPRIHFYHMGLDVRIPVFGGWRTTKTHTSLRICAVWSAPLLFAYLKVSYLDLPQAKFQISS